MRGTLTRRYTMEAAHSLPETHRNHKCHAVHGHNWMVELGIEGPIQERLGWVVDFETIDRVWAGVHRLLDHKLINDTVPNPTSELVAVWVWQYVADTIAKLKPQSEWPADANLAHVVVSENATSSFVYRGEA